MSRRDVKVLRPMRAVHFPAGSTYSCGRSSSPKSTDPMQVTCRACLGEHARFARVVEAIAIEALKTFGGDLSRDQAKTLLDLWAYRSELTDARAAEVLEHFPVRR